MSDRFVLWAQALDNASPDHFVVHGEELSADDSIRRQEAVSLVSSVIKGGTRLYHVSRVLLTADARHFVLEVPSAQRDRAGRTAPIVCYGGYDPATLDSLGASAAVALDDFAARIGRTVQPEHFEHAQSSFEALKKKSSRRRRVRMVGIGAVGAVLLVLAYLLVRSGS